MKKLVIFFSLFFSFIDMMAVPYKRYGRKSRPKVFYSSTTRKIKPRYFNKQQHDQLLLNQEFIEHLKHEHLVLLLACGEVNLLNRLDRLRSKSV